MSIDKNMKILLVEDSFSTRKMEINALNDLGFNNIFEAEDGEQALSTIIEEEDFQLIISDWNMPNMDGFELLEWVRDDEQFKVIPFIMATAQAGKEKKLKAEEAGVSGIITKPFTPPELNFVIEKIFNEDDSKQEEDVSAKDVKPKKTSSGKLLIRCAHIQITDHVVLGVLKYLISIGKLKPKHFELETECMTSWNTVQQAFEKGQIDVAFMLAPIAMDLFAYDVPIKLLLLAHKMGSICVRRKIDKDSFNTLADYYKNKIFYVPHLLSIHHMLSDIFLRELGLEPGLAGKDHIDVTFEVIPPIIMPEILAKNPEVAGYLVAEPLGSKAIGAGNADLVFFSGDIWKSHPCCVVAGQDYLVEKYPEAAQEFIQMLVWSGMIIPWKPAKAAEVAVKFLDPAKKLKLKKAVLTKVLTEQRGIKTNDLFPINEDLERIQNYMINNLKLGKAIDINKFVEPKFAKLAYSEDSLSKIERIVPDMSSNIQEIIKNHAL
ncbi:response regulator receiver modulated CheW protein [Candidatus Magnetomorum sp. HK-1]|nr:response regulator receiver modulated CheW protein [Candidatus Magnetomorum sp. HK-1]